MSQENTSARVIWATEPKDFSQGNADLIHQTKVDGLRVGYTPESEDAVFSFLEQIASGYPDISSMPSIMLDITLPARGRVMGLESEIELVRGNKVKIGKEGCNVEATFEASTSNWPSLFIEGATVYLGYGGGVHRRRRKKSRRSRKKKSRTKRRKSRAKRRRTRR